MKRKKQSKNNKEDGRLIPIYTKLFAPIEKKQVGLWNDPRKSVIDLIKYVRNDFEDNKFITNYCCNKDDGMKLQNAIYLDFDITTKEYLHQEKEYVREVMENLNPSEIKNEYLKKAKEKYDNGIKSLDNYINGLNNNQAKQVKDAVKKHEKQYIPKDEEEKQRYFMKKFEHWYLKEPFEDSQKVVQWFEKRGITVWRNLSGNKGYHVRILIDEITFKNEKLNETPKEFLIQLGELIETEILQKEKGTSSLDYAVFKKGLQRIPCSKHPSTSLYGNFIESSTKYLDSIYYLEKKTPYYVPDLIDEEENTKNFLNLEIVKKAIRNAEKKLTKQFKHESRNPNYNYTSDNTDDLINNIKKIYLEGQRNVLGYRIVHVMRRTEFTKESVEEMFLDIHEGDVEEYNKTIKGSIESAYRKDISKLGGLKHLIEGIETYVDETERQSTIDFFKNHFKYYDKPSVTTIPDFIFNDEKHEVKVYENRYEKWIMFKEITKGLNLSFNLNKKKGTFSKTINKKEESIITFEFELKYGEININNSTWSNTKKYIQRKGYEIKDDSYLIQEINMYLLNQASEYVKPKELDPIDRMRDLFNRRSSIDYARKELGHYLKEKGMILRRSINNPYFLDKVSNGYKSVDIDDIIIAVNNLLDEDSVSSEDVQKAITFIGARPNPEYDVVKFNNCIYDMKNFRVISNDEDPIFTLKEVKYNYNPESEGKLMKEFLKTSLIKTEELPNLSEEEIDEKLKGFLEMVGYILTSGNKLNAFFIITGIGGSGKGTSTSFVEEMFGAENVGDLKLQALNPENRFATSSLINKQLNMIRDSSNAKIKDTSLLKQITGYDNIMVEPKGKDHIIIPKKEVPHMICICNNPPEINDDAVIQRIVLIEFPNRFRGTDKQNPNLESDILSNPDEMEWLIYNGIKAYKNMIEENRDFTNRLTEKETIELLGKHTDPISYLISELVRYTEDEKVLEEEYPICTDDLNQLILYEAKVRGLSVTEIDNKTGKIKSRVLLNKIRMAFELDKEYETKGKRVQNIEGGETLADVKRVYPNLYGTYQYMDKLKEMKGI